MNWQPDRHDAAIVQHRAMLLFASFQGQSVSQIALMQHNRNARPAKPWRINAEVHHSLPDVAA